MAQAFNQQAGILRQALANGAPLFPPPNDDPDDVFIQVFSRRQKSRGYKCTTGYGLLKFFIGSRHNINTRVIGKVAGELWANTNRQNKEAYNELSNQVNLRIKRYRL